jgi:hypothetical protein
MRPSLAALFWTFSLSVVFTVLVAVDVLGVVWLVAGPAFGAATEVVVSHFPDRGTGSAVAPTEPSPTSGPYAPA